MSIENTSVQIYWRNFLKGVEKAQNSWQQIINHLVDVNKMVGVGVGNLFQLQPQKPCGMARFIFCDFFGCTGNYNFSAAVTAF